MVNISNSLPQVANLDDALTCFKEGKIARIDGKIVLNSTILNEWNFEMFQEEFKDRQISCHDIFDGTTFTPSWITVGELCSRLSKLEDSEIPLPGTLERMRLYGAVNSKRLTEIRPILPELNQHFAKAFSFVWVGLSPGGMHCDFFNNILVQVNGRKRITIFLPSESDAICQGHFPELPNKIDVMAQENIDAFPALKDAMGYDIDLEPGDAIIIPSAAYHAPQALSTDSISVNTFFTPRMRNKYLSPHARKIDYAPWWVTNLAIQASALSFRVRGKPLIGMGHYEVM
jgi:hypothetical protein